MGKRNLPISANHEGRFPFLNFTIEARGFGRKWRLKNDFFNGFFVIEFAKSNRATYIIIMRFIKRVLLEKSHAGMQFLKYSMCGGVAMAVDMLAFFLVAWLLFPALTEDEFLVRLFHVPVESVTEGARIVNFCISNVCAFVLSNLTAYILNVLFVFEAGRHSRWKEVGLFYLVSAISVGLGIGIGAILIHRFGLSTSVSYIAKAISTTLINFVARKFIIFRG